MPEYASYNRDSATSTPSSSTPSSTSSSTSFVFKSKRYSRQPDPMSWMNRKPVLSQELLLEHANGAVDLGPFAATIPGFTPLTLLKPEPPSPQFTYIHPRYSESSFPPSFQFPSPPSVQPLRTQPQPSSSRSFASFSSPSTSFSSPSTSTSPRPTLSRESSYSLSLSELILDESASSDEIEMRARESKNVFPPSGRERRRRRKKKRDSENKPGLDTPDSVKSSIDSDKDEDVIPTMTPPNILFSKHSEKTRNALGTTHDCHGKLTTT